MESLNTIIVDNIPQINIEEGSRLGDHAYSLLGGSINSNLSIAGPSSGDILQNSMAAAGIERETTDRNEEEAGTVEKTQKEKASRSMV